MALTTQQQRAIIAAKLVGEKVYDILWDPARRTIGIDERSIEARRNLVYIRGADFVNCIEKFSRHAKLDPARIALTIELLGGLASTNPTITSTQWVVCLGKIQVSKWSGMRL
jgi:hypothetical protein